MRKKISLTLLIVLTLLIIILIIPTQKGIIATKEKQLWKHRTNSIESALLACQKYNGIEIDVVYESNGNYFDVRHNIEDSPTKLSLTLLIDTTKKQKPYYWIDLKNLNYQNVDSIIYLLNSFIKRQKDLKERIIIESNIAEELNKVGQAGFKTSLWIPHYDKDVIGYIKFFIRTKPILLKYKFNALSAQYRMLPMLELYYPQHHFHVWTDDFGQKDFLPVLKELASHPSINVMLVDYETPPQIQNYE